VTKAYGKTLARGQLARLGLTDPATIAAAQELLGRVASLELETIRVLFPDQHGVLRGKTLSVAALESVLADGMAVPSTLLLKDTSHRTVFPIWSAADSAGPDHMRGAGDILLVPDVATFRQLPWSPHSAWILCDAHHQTGDPIAVTPRAVLRRAMEKLAEHDIDMVVGLEVEFHVFEITDPRQEHGDTTMPSQPPQTRALAPGYQFLTETLYARVEPVLDSLRRAAAGIGLRIRSTEIEMGPSQFEFTFDPAGPLDHADNMVMFRTLVKEVCARDGLHASFMCRPRLENVASSGWHLHQSLVRRATGRNLFTPSEGAVLTPMAGHWIAGLLAHARESCLLTTPTVNGYKRYQPFQLAPDRIQWGVDNRGAMIRVLTRPGDPASRIENRVAEPAANPYFYFASQIASGLAGINGQMVPPAQVETPYSSDDAGLPKTLLEAIDAFDGSAMLRDAFGDELIDYLVHLKRAEWERYVATVSEWEHAEYFSLY
jgi:glutamine synthetase